MIYTTNYNTKQTEFNARDTTVTRTTKTFETTEVEEVPRFPGGMI